MRQLKYGVYNEYPKYIVDCEVLTSSLLRLKSSSVHHPFDYFELL
jgi:hypothetical protein